MWYFSTTRCSSLEGFSLMGLFCTLEVLFWRLYSPRLQWHNFCQDFKRDCVSRERPAAMCNGFYSVCSFLLRYGGWRSRKGAHVIIRVLFDKIWFICWRFFMLLLFRSQLWEESVTILLWDLFRKVHATRKDGWAGRNMGFVQYYACFCMAEDMGDSRYYCLVTDWWYFRSICIIGSRRNVGFCAV